MVKTRTRAVAALLAVAVLSIVNLAQDLSFFGSSIGVADDINIFEESQTTQVWVHTLPLDDQRSNSTQDDYSFRVGVADSVQNQTKEIPIMLSSNRTTTIKRTNAKPLLLQVPYYVYEGTTSNAALNWGKKFSNKNAYAIQKHSEDLWLYRASLRHPMRTKDPSKAKLFFVPVLLGVAAARNVCFYLNSTWKECFRGHEKVRLIRAFNFASKHLGLSEYFQRSQGKDHVVVFSHYLVPPKKLLKEASNLYKCNFINFEGRRPIPTSQNISAIPGWYVGSPCNSSPDDERTHDFALVATLKPSNENFASRGNICKWLREGNFSVSHCGEGDQCPAIAQAKYGFHARGDSWGSNRVMDLVLSRTIPLFENRTQYEILPRVVPWENLSYLVDVSNQTSFVTSLTNILSRPASEYHEKRRLIEDYMHIFDHRQIYQFDAHMAELATRLSLQGPPEYIHIPAYFISK